MKYVLSVDPRVTLIEPEKHCKFPVFVRFTGEFSEDNCLKFRQDLMQAENHALEAEQKVLPIVIDSYGGDVYSLLSVIDSINAIDPRITIATVVEGKAMSCGAVLFTCGHEGYRFIAPNATVMIHEVSSAAYGKNEEIKASAKESDRLNEKIFAIMAKNCGHTDPTYFTKLISGKKHADWYLEAEDCITHKLANKIGTPKFKVDVSVDISFDDLTLPTQTTPIVKTKSKK